MSRIKLADWARDNGVTYVTAWRWWNAGQLSGMQLPSGTILIDTGSEEQTPDTKSVKRAAVYARVSCSENKDNAKTQAERVSKWAVANGYEVCSKTIEVGSGLNDSRRKLNSLLTKRNFDVLIVEHKDRLTRFGFEYINMYLESYGKEIIVINKVDGDEEDLMQDFVSLVTSFCSRLYGRRRSRRITEKLIEEASRD